MKIKEEDLTVDYTGEWWRFAVEVRDAFYAITRPLQIGESISLLRSLPAYVKRSMAKYMGISQSNIVRGQTISISGNPKEEIENLGLLHVPAPKYKRYENN